MEHSFTGPDGKTYTLSPLTLKDRQDLRSRVQYLEYHEFVKLKGQFPAAAFSDHCRDLMMLGSKKGWEQIITDTDRFMTSDDGIAYLVYLHLRHKHPITPEDVADLVTLENVEQIKNCIFLLNPEVEGSKKKQTLISESSTDTPPSISSGLPNK